MTTKTDFMVKEISGDLLTPISILQKISGGKKFLLESSNKFNQSGRYSFIGADPAIELISFGKINTIIRTNGQKRTLQGNPLDILNDVLPSRDLDDLPFPFIGGAVGYVGYDIVRQYEEIGHEYSNSLEMPDVHLMFYEEVIVYDHLEEKVYICGIPLEHGDLDLVREKMGKREVELKKTYHFAEEEPFSFSGFQSETTKEAFIHNVETAKEHIFAGDIFQVVLSRRMRSEFQGSPLSLYRKHRTHNPTPYMFYIDFDNYTVIGSSPESLIKTRGKTVIANPIAGTRKRGKTNLEDLALEKELLADEKELAEHKMLVDLGRNDLGKVCEFGSVKVEKYMAVEKFRHVMHLVSEVSGQLRSDQTPLAALAACLPAGTVSGAPKVRAMEIINTLEKSKRGLYSGAIGYVSANGNIDFALAIRTMILKEGCAYIQAGAGIVHDSDPESEYEETANKLKSFLEGREVQ
ncbi:anthranilate synthase component I [Neobacillus sp. YIM B02564]|jgi:anthranilate synthase component 1|uniref:Anthranilate synthase component 1 n=1 Tax=Neobacillus paridis TaxID=2803862 RepID=A0ABS1TRH6_9BACI|nr:anthranilate synthase component I [Neobacillus paridis]MBL4953892.1 anthranilate synthase component I [Neobacillus paridis]